MTSTNQTALVISGNSGNDAINGIMLNFSEILEQAGFNILFIDISNANESLLQSMVDQFETGRVAFGLTYLGIGQDWTVQAPDGSTPNLWDHFEVPLLKLHGDMPAYFLARHQNTPSCSANLYPADEFLDQHNWLLPSYKRSPSFRYGPWIISNTPFSQIDFNRKTSGQLVFMKNGGSPEDLVNLWRTKLPVSISKRLFEMAETVSAQMNQDNHPSIQQAVLEHASLANADTDSIKSTLRLLTVQLDDYTRRVKSTMITKALLELPVIIQGSRWEHIDFSKARASLAPPQSYSQSEAIFRNQLGVIDMTPNINTGCHDRMMRAAGTYSFMLSNRTDWLAKMSPSLHERAFHFQAEHIAQSAAWAIDNPEECIDLGIKFAEEYRKAHDNHTLAEQLSLIAEIVRIEKTNIKFELQPFFVR